VAVRFVSAQPGVEILVDGNPQWSCVTPCSIELERGRHEFFANRAGFRRLRRSFEVNQNPFDIQFKLDPVAGTVLVASQPDGAEIYVDGTKQNQKTNATLKLPPGQHVIRVVREGGASAERTVEVTENGLQTLRFVLGNQ
jgi:hypothetical protein